MNFCVICGHKTTEKIPLGDHQLRRVSADCGNTHYVNPKVICGALVLWGNQVLLCRRAIGRRYGLWTLPAGYMELFGTMEQGAARNPAKRLKLKSKSNSSTVCTIYSRIGQIYSSVQGQSRQWRTFGAGEGTVESRILREHEIPLVCNSAFPA